MVDTQPSGNSSAFGRFDPLLQEKIVSNLGWTSLRPVQDMAAHEILDGHNCVILAPTAGGKTEAAMFPVLSGCLRNQEPGMRALYISPTRALINNQEERLGRYAEMVGLGAFKWHGDVTPARRQAFLREPLELVLTTPESLEVMLDSGRVPTAALFRNLKYVVIDEIHALAASDRGAHLLCTLERIRRYARLDFQRIGLSATVGNPDDITRWMQGSSTNPAVLVDPPKAPGVKEIAIVSAQEPGEVDALALAALKSCKSLLFCESRRLSERIAGSLRKTGEPVWVHHSSLSREEREEAEARFTNGTEACIVCTSTMELGIDVGDLDKVLQINAPSTVSSFLQRLGRTGRRPGTVSNTTFIIEKDDAFLQAIAIVELARTHWVESIKPISRAWHIMLHQIMALCLERGGVAHDEPERVLRNAACFSDVDHESWAGFIDYLLEKDFLHDDGGMLSMGLEAEKVFGRRNFMELYSVFSSPVEFEVAGLSGDVIGTVEWDFLEKLLESQGSFFLSGQAWAIERIEWKKKLVIVSKAPAGKVPMWGGLSPRFIGYELSRKKRDILAGNDMPAYLSAEARIWLTSLRADKGAFLSDSFAPIEHDDRGFQWHTWAGGRINNTIRFALKAELGVDVQATNELVRIPEVTVPWPDISRVIDAMASLSFWTEGTLMDRIQAMLPEWRLSKFQGYLPDAKRRELIAMTILDVEGTVRFMKDIREGEV
jgi:ATP-dependent Lhr-like helicase